MRLLFFILVISLGFTSCADTIAPELSHPSIEEVLTKLEGANFGSQERMKNMQLARKPDGWYLRVLDYSENQLDPIVEEGRFWAVSDSSYHMDSLPDLSGVGMQQFDNIRKQPSIKWQFQVHQFFGYEGWSKDIIEQYGDFDIYSDTLLYGLGRAYSDYPIALINAGENTDLEEAFHLEDDALLSEAQVKTYCKYADLSIASFAKLKEQNPNFETKVGNISLKHSNEHITAYIDLCVYSNDFETASSYIKDDLYDDFTIAFAKNFLSSCKENGVLFTAGDNSTYPLWYVQQKLNFRKDVNVVNNSYLNVPRYSKLLENPIDGTAPVPCGISPASYSSIDREYVILSSGFGNSAVVTMEALMDYIDDDANLVDGENGRLITVPGSTFLLPTPDARPINDTVPAPPGIYFSIRQSSYLARGEYLFLGIITDNMWERPIYISALNPIQNDFNIDGNLFSEGLVLHLEQDAGEMSGQRPIDHEMLEQHLLNDFDWDWFPNMKEANDDFQENIIQNYRYLYVSLAEAYYTKGDTAAGLRVTKAGIEQLPATHLSNQELGYLIAENFYIGGDQEQGRAYTTTLVDEMESGINELMAIEKLSDEKAYKLEQKINVLATMERIVALYDADSELATRLELLNGTIWQQYMEKQSANAAGSMPPGF